MNIQDDTASFEAWLRAQCDLNEDALRAKHAAMAESDPFPFFRATYYRWARLWREVCRDLLGAPTVLAIGDIHLENFGTWRDSDGRLCWGVNDFDEVDELPYAHDLVRLAASTRFARKSGSLDKRLSTACDIVLKGYRECLEKGGQPFVLEEDHSHLRAIALAADQEPAAFWAKRTASLTDAPPHLPDAARESLIDALPNRGLQPEFRARMQAGVGSLGKPRYIALVKWNGGWICREAKAVTRPATAWLHGKGMVRTEEAVLRSVRSPDPFYRPGPAWLTRRLAPHCSRIELKHMSEADASRVLEAMGREIANVHLATAGAAKPILDDLDGRLTGWLSAAAHAMAETVEKDWEAWCKHPLK